MELLNGCQEYRDLSRRTFLKRGTAAALATSMLPAWMPRVAMASSYSSSRDVIVSIYLRGGIDGLTACVPHGDDNYYALRPTIAIARPDANDPYRSIDLDGFFGLPPSMKNMIDPYRDGKLLFVHATGMNDGTRSHFDAQRYMEVGLPGSLSLQTGWLGRHLASINPMDPLAPLRATVFGYSTPRTLVGGLLTTPVPNPTSYNLTGPSSTRDERRARLADMYNTDASLATVAANTQATIDLLQRINVGGYVPAGGVVYGTDTFGTSMKYTAALIRADAGVEAIHVDYGGWDTHSNQGPTTGTMATLLQRLSAGLSSLYADLSYSGHFKRTIVVAMSEFGRVAKQNGSAGTDHGHGNMMMMMGGGVIGGRVYADWPGLGPGQLYQNQDLAVTRDYRDVLAEIVRKRLGNSQLGLIFPDYTPNEWGLVESY